MRTRRRRPRVTDPHPLKTAVPTHGMSSPVVWGKRLFLTGADSGQAWSGAVLCADVGQNGRQEDDDG